MQKCDKTPSKRVEKCEKILSEIVEFCEGCKNRECCLEEECVLYRIEQIMISKENKQED